MLSKCLAAEQTFDAGRDVFLKVQAVSFTPVSRCPLLHFGAQVTATASREESREWCEHMGAAKVIPHKAVDSLPPSEFDYILSLSDQIDIAFLARILKPFGKVRRCSSLF